MQNKVLKILVLFFLANSVFIFVFPFLISQLDVFPLVFSLESILRQVAVILFGLIILKVGEAVGMKLKAVGLEPQVEEAEGGKLQISGFVIVLCVYEFLVILAMLSMIIWADLFSYLFLGILGLSKLIREAIKINKLTI